MGSAAARCRYMRSSQKGDWALLAYRTIIAGYSLFVYFYTLNTEVIHFFTGWNWTLLVVYFFAASMASLQFLFCGGIVKVSDFHFGLARSCQVLLSVLAPSVVLICIIVWSILYPTSDSQGKKDYLAFSSCNKHIANFFIVFVELVCNSMPFQRRDAVGGVLWVTSFGIFTELYYAGESSERACLVEDTQKCAKIWPYFFMNTSKPLAALWYIGVLFLFAVAYLFICNVSNYFLEKRAVVFVDARSELPTLSDMES